MTFKTGLVTYLRSKSVITDLVSDRIYDQVAPQGKQKPFITFQLISGDKPSTFEGQSGTENKIMQINCVSESGKKCDEISEALRNSLNGFRGSMGSVFVQGCLFRNERDDYDPPIHGEDRGVFIKSDDYSIWYNESLPANL